MEESLLQAFANVPSLSQGWCLPRPSGEVELKVVPRRVRTITVKQAAPHSLTLIQVIEPVHHATADMYFCLLFKVRCAQRHLPANKLRSFMFSAPIPPGFAVGDAVQWTWPVESSDVLLHSYSPSGVCECVCVCVRAQEDVPPLCAFLPVCVYLFFP
jgi:hypothetical protein